MANVGQIYNSQWEYFHILGDKTHILGDKLMSQSPEEYMDVSKNSGTPKSSILIGFSIINHPFGGTLIFGNTHMNADLFKATLQSVFCF